MALFNPPELRASMMCIIVFYLAQRRGQQDEEDRIINAISPPSLTDSPQKHQRDARLNLKSAVDLGLAHCENGRIKLSPESTKAAGQGSSAVATLLRERILSPELNTASWGSQAGARDLTNALAWFLTFHAVDAPNRWERTPNRWEDDPPLASFLQERDFGPRQSEDDDKGGWPISNDARWNTFRRWACSLGFAWRSPSGRLIPDPTPAIRDSIPTIFNGQEKMGSQFFIAALGAQLPVLETGAYRCFVEENWKRPAKTSDTLSTATTDALYRLEATGHLTFENRADTSKIRRSDGTTFSHVSNRPRR